MPATLVRGSDVRHPGRCADGEMACVRSYPSPTMIRTRSKERHGRPAQGVVATAAPLVPPAGGVHGAVLAGGWAVGGGSRLAGGRPARRPRGAVARHGPGG